jgi:hypothetical protein
LSWATNATTFLAGIRLFLNSIGTYLLSELILRSN